MSKKRTPNASSSYEQTNKHSDPAFQQNDKRAKRTSISNTVLQDLPIELIECILIRAVTMEVKDMKLAKCVWKEKVDLVISRLTAVCPQWSDILTTNYFRNELHRYLDQTAQETFRLKILYQSLPLHLSVTSITTMKDEIFLHCTCTYRQGDFINIYDRDKMAVVKDVISLSGYNPHSIAACGVSNCVYVLCRVICDQYSILRIDRDNRFTVLQVGSSIYLPKPTMHVTGDGSLVFSRDPCCNYPTPVRLVICNANGSVRNEMSLPTKLSWFRNIIPKSNGNLVCVSSGIEKLTEIDMDGKIIRQYKQPSLSYTSQTITRSDNYGRLLIAGAGNAVELLDSEFNLVDLSSSLLGAGQIISHHGIQYNSERDEMVALVELPGQNDKNHVLTIFRLTGI